MTSSEILAIVRRQDTGHIEIADLGALKAEGRAALKGESPARPVLLLKYTTSMPDAIDALARYRKAWRERVKEPSA